MKICAGVQVGPYQIIEQVGRGGMATVFKAYQQALERMVASGALHILSLRYYALP